jgi:hypothetical protein
VRQVDDRLDELPELVRQQAVQDQGHHDRRRKDDDGLDRGQDQGVLHRIEEFRVTAEDDGKVFESGPQTFTDPEVRLVILKSNDIAPERVVLERQQDQHPRYREQKNRVVTP